MSLSELLEKRKNISFQIKSLLLRLKGVAWKEIDGYGLTISRLKHIFRESCKILNIVWQD